MRYEILGKKITGVSEGCNELILHFNDGVCIIIRAAARVDLDSEGKLMVTSGIEVTTDKIELKAS